VLEILLLKYHIEKMRKHPITFAIWALFLLVQPTLGVIVVSFEEDAESGTLSVSFSGTLSLDPNLAQLISSGTGSGRGIIEPFGIRSSALGQLSWISGAGSPEIVRLPSDGMRRIGTLIGGKLFGYSEDLGRSVLWLSEGFITGGDRNGVSEISVTPEDTSMVFEGTYDSFGIDEIPENTVLWRADTTNDTIIFSRFPPGSIPEPSTFIMCLLGVSTILRRHR